LADQEQPAVRVAGEDRDGARVPHEIPLGPGTVGPLDRRVPELHVPATMDHANVDDPLGERVIRGG
jgi:hypothetical protein